MNDPYAILGVAKTATQDEIKKAYRELAKKHHPDLNPGKRETEAKFQEISNAYEQIGSPEARAKFDRGETEEQQRERARDQSTYYRTQQEGGRYSQAFGEDDLFETLFGSAQSRTGGRRATQSRADAPGEDQLFRLEVDFKDAALGAERELTLPSGKKLLVKIPAGIDSGQRLRFKGQGGPGRGKGPAGDAYVEVAVKPGVGFTRAGNNIETELPISFQEGILGAEIKVPTVDGHVLLKVPAGTSTGARLRIRGKGAGAEPARGDQVVVIKVTLPKKVDPAFQEAVRGLDAKFSYNPRAEEGM